jgi:hypothetical protein
MHPSFLLLSLLNINIAVCSVIYVKTCSGCKEVYNLIPPHQTLWLSVYKHTHTHTRTYVRTYVHTYIHTYVHTYVHTYIIHTYIHTHTHTHTHTYIHTYIQMYIYIVSLNLNSLCIIGKR